jgi:NIMA (never in mitosis gene a)-related kinase
MEKAKTMVGTPYYISPEIIEGKAYSLMTDIWSLGVILYELCALKPPFNAESINFLALKIVKGQVITIN